MMARARARAEGVAAEKIHNILLRRYKILKRELRRANLRKRLAKTLRDTGSLFKQDDDESWDDWIAGCEDDIRDALSPIVVTVEMVEQKYWQSRDVRPAEIAPQQIFDAYEARTGHQIKDIAQQIKNDCLGMISDWYNTDEGLPELIDKLGSLFSEARAETIARTESSFITSQYSLELMNQFKVEYWNHELGDDMGEYPCEICLAEAEANPHRVGDPMPPESTHPRCRCGASPANEDGTQFTFGADIDVDDPGIYMEISR